MRSTIEFIAAGANVRRFHTVPTIQTDTVGHHSHGVAMFCMLIHPNPSHGLLVAALLHDLAEQVVGDIPSPAKRQFDLNEKVSELEEQILRQHDLLMPVLTHEESRTLKLADIASGAMFCVQEVKMGNRNLEKVFWRYMAYAAEMNLDRREAQVFGNLKEMFDECK